MPEKRGQIRTPLRAQVKLQHPKSGEFPAFTRDMSDGGLYVIVDDPQAFTISDKVTVQSTDIEDAPVIPARVVRVEKTGVALMYAFDD